MLAEESKIENKVAKVDKDNKDANAPDTIEGLSVETQETIKNVLTKL